MINDKVPHKKNDQLEKHCHQENASVIFLKLYKDLEYTEQRKLLDHEVIFP